MCSPMENNQKSENRKGEIIAFFYAIFSHRIQIGMNPEDARHQAYEAVELRYEIGKGRLLNIISERKRSQKVNISSLQSRAVALISELGIVNDALEETKARNEKLIGLLQECLDDGC